MEHQGRSSGQCGWRWGRIRSTWWCVVLGCFVGLVGPQAQAALTAGDIALIGYTSDDPDALAFVTLAPIAAGETIRFTDSGWFASGGFRSTEGGIEYTAPVALPAGTVVEATAPFNSGSWSVNNEGVGGSGFLLSTAGDQILVFQGVAAAPQFIYALHADSSGWDDAVSSNTSALPTGLIDGVTAVDIGTPERDNGYYAGPTAGTPEQLRAEIGDPGNWITESEPQTWPEWEFAVLGGGNTPLAFAGLDRTILLSNATVTELMVDAIADDPNGLAGLTYEWTPESGPGIVEWAQRTGQVLETTSPAEAAVTLDDVGAYLFTLTVTDPGGLMATDTVLITVEVPPPPGAYDPPADYYDPARPGGEWLTGVVLENALRGIIDDHTVRSYDAARSALQLLDQDPLDPTHIILFYTGDSVRGVWDGGATWNREHLWPISRTPGGITDSDLHDLRPCDPIINSTRGNKPFGEGAGYWDADLGANDRGNAARAMFYMDTRYTALTLVEGMPSGYEMGDLAALLEWHYEDPVSEAERRRNHLIYSAAENPAYYQGNRNPFVDHPELVWTIWGPGPNEAQLYFGASAEVDGSSLIIDELGAIIVDGPLPGPVSATLHKIGTDPTTYEITTGGVAISAAAGPRQAFASDGQDRTISASLSGPASSPGQLTGQIIVDNTELTAAGSGLGANDGDDIWELQLDVLAHAEGSWVSEFNMDSLGVDFGSVPANSGVYTIEFTLYNLEPAAGFTAALDVDAVAAAGDTHVLSTNLLPLSDLPPGDSVLFTATFDSAATAGEYLAAYDLEVSDEDLPGALAGTPMSVYLVGIIESAGVFPFDADGDGDIDLVDYEQFELCLDGPQAGPLSGPCALHDVDFDDDVDLEDASDFWASFGS
jgi:endonuclease I